MSNDRAKISRLVTVVERRFLAASVTGHMRPDLGGGRGLRFCKAWHPRLAHDIFEPKSGFLTWSVLAYWAYALEQIYLAGGRAAVLSKEALGPAACAIAGYFLLANLPELSGV